MFSQYEFSVLSGQYMGLLTGPSDAYVEIRLANQVVHCAAEQ